MDRWIDRWKWAKLIREIRIFVLYCFGFFLSFSTSLDFRLWKEVKHFRRKIFLEKSFLSFQRSRIPTTDMTTYVLVTWHIDLFYEILYIHIYIHTYIMCVCVCVKTPCKWVYHYYVSNKLWLTSCLICLHQCLWFLNLCQGRFFKYIYIYIYICVCVCVYQPASARTGCDTRSF